jgi:hypothetical protein
VNVPEECTTVDRVYRGLFQGGFLAPYAESRFYELHVGCAVEVPPNGDYAGRAKHLMLDDPDPRTLKPRWSRNVLAAAKDVAEAVARGHRVLVTCAMGWNRSGLVSALALCRLGFSPEDAMRTVRRARGSGALSNKSFRRAVLVLSALQTGRVPQ